jgi:Fe-S oxidoreductase
MRDLAKNKNAPSMKLIDDRKQEEMLWQVRKSGLGATAHVPNKKITWEGWEDAAVAPEKLGNYLRDFRKLLDRYEYRGDLYGHFGQGCVHTRTDFDLETHEGIEKFRSFLEDASDLVIKYGGSLSGEHGDGQSRAWLLPKMFGRELIEAFREFKSIWDPEWKMNPGKVVDPYDVTENLRIGTSYRPATVTTHFKWPTDKGSFPRASLRCVGVGECRKIEGGTMCPSYRVTMEEKHSTRGRARLLWEMLQGEVVKDGWKNEAVKDALDLCLACKGCKGECPVTVDMASYKAEFLSHYYQGRFRPRHAYAFGYIDFFARLASIAPSLVNFFTQTRPLDSVAKWLAQVPQQRKIPAFSRQSFKRWFETRKPKNQRGHKVILWPDTFNNYFFSDTSTAAVEVLESANCRVEIPKQALCCGRPLYDFGMLDRARRLLKRILSSLRDEIADGTPVVVLEPSCLAVFRDEMTNLLPDDEDAKRLSEQTFLLSEFLEKKVESFEPPALAGKALVHGHCHQKALMGMDSDQAMLRKLGMDFELLDSGCCGMAGSFGFEKDHYEVSIAAGELVLLPAVRETTDDTLIITNGFSCREQIAQTTGRRALHLAEVLRMAMTNQKGTTHERRS